MPLLLLPLLLGAGFPSVRQAAPNPAAVQAAAPGRSPAPAPVAAQPEPDPGTFVLSTDAEERWVPFELTPDNHIRFGMTLNGQPRTALLDTGVSFSMLARHSSAVDASKVREGGSAAAIGGSIPIGWMPTGSMVVGGLTRSGGSISVADLPNIAASGEGAVDLLVGRDLLAGQALDIDYAAHRFRLIRSGRMPFSGSVAPLWVSAERRIYESELTLGGHRVRPVLVDTGDGSSITVTSTGWAAAGLAAVPTTTALVYGAAGPVVSRLAVVPSLTLGYQPPAPCSPPAYQPRRRRGVAARRQLPAAARRTACTPRSNSGGAPLLTTGMVEIRIEPDDGFSTSIGTAGRIGSGFLQNYRVLLDPGARRMVLSPGPNADKPPLRSTTGILGSLLPDRISVVHVMKNSPAEMDGWKAGDTICSVNGQPITANPDAALVNWSIAPVGTVIRLGRCDGTVRTLTARAFY